MAGLLTGEEHRVISLTKKQYGFLVCDVDIYVRFHCKSDLYFRQENLCQAELPISEHCVFKEKHFLQMYQFLKMCA